MSHMILRSLGTTYGYHEVAYTTYADRGLLNTTRPAWMSWREVEPTVSGLMAGSLRLLLDPSVVAAAQAGTYGMPLADYLVCMWSNCLAAIFGDTDTLDSLRRTLHHQNTLYVPAENLPEWYQKSFGRRSIDLSDDRRRFAMLITLLGAVADAHVETGLVNHAEIGTEYVRDLHATVFPAHSLTLPHEGPDGEPILRTVTTRASVYADQPQLDRKLARRAQVLGDSGLLEKVLDADLGSGFTMRSFYPTFGGLVPKPVRDALELTWTKHDQERFRDWASMYAGKVQDSPMRPIDWFDVAVKTRRP